MQPEQDLGPLFYLGAGAFPEGKAFVDAVPRTHPAEITQAFSLLAQEPDFDPQNTARIRAFVDSYFFVPDVTAPSARFLGPTPESHIQAMWGPDYLLTYQPDDDGTLIGQEHPYITPSYGPYFREQYYWDTLFTNLGLELSGLDNVAEGQVRNMANSIDARGFVPNGTRRYQLDRTQDPVFAITVDRLAWRKGDDRVLVEFLPTMLKEDAFYSLGEDELTGAVGGTAINRVVRMRGGEILDRAFTASRKPRAERLLQDIASASLDTTRPPEDVYQDTIAGTGTGRDFFSGLLKDGQSLHTIHTTDLVLVQRNCFRIIQQRIIAKALTAAAKYADTLEDRDYYEQQAAVYRAKAGKRAAALVKYSWDEGKGFLFDYDFVADERKKTWHMGAAATALYAGILTPRQAERVGQHLEERFLRPGGFATSLHTTGPELMWDGSDPADKDVPANGFAPDHYLGIQGLRRYKQFRRAREAATRWVGMNRDVFYDTGMFFENYDVNGRQPGNGGEKVVQDGFGWTNGVYLSLADQYGLNRPN